MELKNYFAQDASGNVLPGAQVDVFFPGTTTRASGLEGPEGSSKSNPFFADSKGLISFAAPNGFYDLRVTSGMTSYTIRIQFVDVSEQVDAANSAASSANDSAIAAAESADEADAKVQVLRDDLSNTSDPALGAALVGYRGGTVADKLDRIITPYDFPGDSTAQLNAFFAYIAENDVGEAYLFGDFTVNGKITYSGSASSTKVIHCGAIIRSNFSATDEILRFEGIPGLCLTGSIKVLGAGGTNYANRTNGDGVVVHNCAQFQADYIEIFYVKRNGFSATGVTSQFLIHYLKTWYCGGGAGSGATTKSFDFSAVSNTGSSGGTNQRSIMTIAPGAAEGFVANRTLIKVGSTLHLVTAFDNASGSVTVYPWIESGITQGTASVYFGAGYFGEGPDNSAGYITKLDTLVCGVGCYNRALYPVSIGSHVSQYCGAAHVIGSAISNASVGGQASYSYYESSDYDIVQLTTANVGYEFSATTALSLDKCVKFSPRISSGEFNGSFTFFNGISVGIDGAVMESRRGAISGSAVSTLRAELTANAAPIYTNRVNSGVINLIANPENQRLFAMNDLMIVLSGSGTNGQPTGVFTINPEAGYTVNGQASITLSGFVGPTIIHAWLTQTNWNVRVVGEQILAATTTYDPPSIPNGASETTTVAVTGAATGDFVDVSFSRDTQGVIVTGWVSAADTVSVRFQNNTGSAVDLPSGTIRVRLKKS